MQRRITSRRRGQRTSDDRIALSRPSARLTAYWNEVSPPFYFRRRSVRADHAKCLREIARNTSRAVRTHLVKNRAVGNRGNPSPCECTPVKGDPPRGGLSSDIFALLIFSVSQALRRLCISPGNVRARRRRSFPFPATAFPVPPASRVPVTRESCLRRGLYTCTASAP